MVIIMVVVIICHLNCCHHHHHHHPQSSRTYSAAACKFPIEQLGLQKNPSLTAVLWGQGWRDLCHRIMEITPAMKAPCELVWFFSSEGATQLSYRTGTVQLHKVLNINLSKTKRCVKEKSSHRLINRGSFNRWTLYRLSKIVHDGGLWVGFHS